MVEVRGTPRNVRNGVMDDTVFLYNRIVMDVGVLIVSKFPPWSMATSTMTEPGCIDFTISSVTSFGAFARELKPNR